MKVRKKLFKFKKKEVQPISMEEFKKISIELVDEFINNFKKCTNAEEVKEKN